MGFMETFLPATNENANRVMRQHQYDAQAEQAAADMAFKQSIEQARLAHEQAQSKHWDDLTKQQMQNEVGRNARLDKSDEQKRWSKFGGNLFDVYHPKSGVPLGQAVPLAAGAAGIDLNDPEDAARVKKIIDDQYAAYAATFPPIHDVGTAQPGTPVPVGGPSTAAPSADSTQNMLAGITGVLGGAVAPAAMSAPPQAPPMAPVGPQPQMVPSRAEEPGNSPVQGPPLSQGEFLAQPHPSYIAEQKMLAAKQAEKEKVDAANIARKVAMTKIQEDAAKERIYEFDKTYGLKDSIFKFQQDMADQKQTLAELDQKSKALERTARENHWKWEESRPQKDSILKQYQDIEKRGIAKKTQLMAWKTKELAKLPADRQVLIQAGFDPEKPLTVDEVSKSKVYLDPQMTAKVLSASARIQSSKGLIDAFDSGVKEVDENINATRDKMRTLGAGPTNDAGKLLPFKPESVIPKGNLPRMNSVKDALRLPKGMHFIDANGVERVRP